jgi:cysteine desulfurase
MEKRRVYLDNSATTEVHPEVIKVMRPYFCGIYGNASSFHSFGREAGTALAVSRAKTAALLNAAPDEIIFTGCGTESDNIAIFGVLNAYGKKGHIITSKIEHHAVLYSCRHLESLGYEVTYLDADKDGIVCAEDLKKAVKGNTLLITIMHANNEVGSLQPIEEIGAFVREINKDRKDRIYFHTDAVQSAGKIAIDVKKMGVDLLSVAAHKFHGPKGVGALYVKKGVNIKPVMFGGHHESGLRPGTENIPYIVGLTKALTLAVSKMEEHNKHILFLREKLKKGIEEKIPEIVINGGSEKSVSNILNVSFKYIEGESLLAMLDMQGIAASTGSACASGEEGASHVLSAMRVDPIAAQGAIRFSFSSQNTESDIDYVLEVLPGIVEKLRAMSPVYNGNK